MCLISTLLPVPEGPSTIETWSSGRPRFRPFEDARAAELLDQVDDLDRVLAAVVALAAGVESVGVVRGRVDTGDDEVAAHHGAVLAHVGAGRLGAFRVLPGRRGGRRRLGLGQLGAGLGLRLVLGLLGLVEALLLVHSVAQPPIGARGLAPQKTRVPSIPMMWTKTMFRTIDLAVAVPTPTGPPEAV